MADTLVTCINKPDTNSPHEHITHLGGYTWRRTTQEVIASIEKGTNTFYTSVGGKRADIGVRERNGRKFVQTHADGYWNDNLLALDTCPLR
ncbi:DUF3892 domain-containing protein [Ktedonobacteria bacterium brp13]|nr:DUF3892 domain-containing protein [Ktedonobacteria bacterium brp13]